MFESELNGASQKICFEKALLEVLSPMNFAIPLPKFEFDDKILDQGAEISRRLNQLRMEKFP
ncbi:hypothetical protein NZA98_11725, partial [Escherichia coli]|nr:hypothetical protein [Escherichia coli]